MSMSNAPCVGGEHAAEVIHPHGNEHAAIRRGGDLGLVGSVIDFGEFVLGGLVFLLVPAAKTLAEFFDVHLHACAGNAGGDKEQDEGAEIHAASQCCKKQFFQLRGGQSH